MGSVFAKVYESFETMDPSQNPKWVYQNWARILKASNALRAANLALYFMLVFTPFDQTCVLQGLDPRTLKMLIKIVNIQNFDFINNC